MAAGRLEIEIMARLDKLEAGLKKAETQTRKTGKTLDDEMGTPMGKLTVKAGKLFAAMGAIEATTKLASTATAGFQGLFAAISGDGEKAQRSFEAMAETAKSLPFGIGPVVAAFEQMLFTVSGLNEKLAQQEEKLKEIAELDRVIALHRGNASAIAGLEARLAIAQATTEEQRIQLQFQADVEALERANTERLRKAQGEQGRTKQKLIEDSQRQLEIETELARIARNKALDMIEEQKRMERISRMEAKRAEEARQAEQERAKAQRERDILEKKAQREAQEAAKKLADQQRQAQREAKEAAREQAKQLAEAEKLREAERKASEDAARATSTASTAFGTFRFGQVRSGSGQEKANAHLQGIEEGIGMIQNMLRTNLRQVGVN
jgi:chemotaxis protein histidine kinase CheA